MPLYDVKCSGCGKEEAVLAKLADFDNIRCMDCDNPMRVLITMKSHPVTFREGYFDNIANDPIYCRTPQELRDACDEHDGTSRYLQDGLFKTTPGSGADKFDKAHPGGRTRRKIAKAQGSYRIQEG